LGDPIEGVRIHVLDAHGEPVRIGEVGELFVEGAQIAPRYRGDPELSRRAFVDGALLGRPGSMLFRTGDRCRVAQRGVLEYVGRVDRQLNVNGLRIDPLELERTVAEHPAVAEVAVIARAGDSGSVLTAYFSSVSAPPSSTALRTWMLERIPTYAVPGCFVHVPALPRNSNGKVDVRALAALAERPTTAEHCEARTPLEQRLVAIFESVLGVSPLGTSSDFFGLGGTSMTAVDVATRTCEALGIDLPLAVLVHNPTVGDLACYIEKMMIEREAE
jgi:acyl-coenzyme A synthetase/AMP-(fatty) acid ligase/acyl carrier protein